MRVSARDLRLPSDRYAISSAIFVEKNIVRHS